MFVFPTHLLNPTTIKPGVEGGVVSGGVALSGEEDVVATDGGGRLRIDYSGIVLRSPELLRLWNAWDGYLSRGVVACLVPLVSLATAPRPWAGFGPRPVFAIAGDDPMFPTSVGYQVRTIVAALGANAFLRATQIDIRVTLGSDIRGGEWFSIGQRAHRVVRKIAGTIFQIEPPLRASVNVGTPVEFEWPVVKATVATGQDLGLPIQLSRRSEQSISFVEAA